ncbi:MAG: hypothetical protein KC505_04225 [Myxococcales bacterium]|nr:hypothetical protein [Myxococcales bacterium]USN50211.1 MAG: hypothetical protein H6731_08055 [Myxococcales bacterium]
MDVSHSQNRLNSKLSLIAAASVFLVTQVLQAQENRASQKQMVADDKEIITASGEKIQLPNLSDLIKAKIGALKNRLNEQDILLAKIDLALAKEQEREKQVFDEAFYLSMSMFNAMPQAQYKLISTEIWVDKKLVSQGGKNNYGLPRNNQRIYFSPLSSGCHEVIVKAKVQRLRNDVLNKFKGLNKIENIENQLTISTRDGYEVGLDIELFESQKFSVKDYRSPSIRFNPVAKPIFLPGAPLVSKEEVLNQGQLLIDYVNDDNSHYHLLSKNLSIDGLPILSQQEHNEEQEKNIVYKAPLAQGRHKLNVALLFGEKTRVQGGPTYKFRLSFEREFFVRSGQTSLVNLIAMPDGGNRRNPYNARYARVSSVIKGTNDSAIFPEKSCRELKAIEVAAEKNKKISQPQVQSEQPKNSDQVMESPQTLDNSEEAKKAGE